MNYKEVMKQYNLGPNGGIMTSLNLFSTKFSEVNKVHSSVPSKFKVHSSSKVLGLHQSGADSLHFISEKI